MNDKKAYRILAYIEIVVGVGMIGEFIWLAIFYFDPMQFMLLVIPIMLFMLARSSLRLSRLL